MSRDREEGPRHLTLEAIDAAVEAIRSRTSAVPEIAVVADAGVAAALTGALEIEAVVEVPLLPPGTGAERMGEWRFGTLEGARVVVLNELVHPGEGHPLRSTTWPIRLLGRIGARILIRAGLVDALNPLWAVGDLVRVDDHINLMRDNPLIGPNLDALGPRFPDMSEAYDRALGRLAGEVALEMRVPLRQGVYVAVPWRGLETPAESRMLRSAGGDMVGAGTVPEVLVARQMGVRVLALAAVGATRLPAAESRALEAPSGEADRTAEAAETAETPEAAEARLAALIGRVVGRVGRGEAR